MMTNLFDIFDPSTSVSLSLNWLSFLLPLVVVPLIYWQSFSRFGIFSGLLNKSLAGDLKNSFKGVNLKSVFLYISLFWCLLVWNFLGLFPYIFTPTSHLSVSVAIAFPLWLAFMFYGWSKNTEHMFSHLITEGTPLFLSVFMVFIETISSAIRPLTLSVRLSANMIAGHLLVSLLSGVSVKAGSLFLVSGPTLVCLLGLEMAVALIQSYVFITLASLYMNEI